MSQNKRGRPLGSKNKVKREPKEKEIKVKRKIGRPNTGSKYMEETLPYQFRVEKELLKQFRIALAKKKVKGWKNGKSFFANDLFRDVMEKLIKEVELEETSGE